MTFLLIARVLPRNWFKGADTASLLRFLEHRIGNALKKLKGTTLSFFSDMLAAIAAANAFMRCLYSSALFLFQTERDELLSSGHACINAFHRLANKAFEMNLTRWKYNPKLHMLGEVLYELEYQRRKHLPSMSPLSWITQQDEDFVGRVSAFSRSVSIRTVHTRTLGRYLIALGARW